MGCQRWCALCRKFGLAGVASYNGVSIKTRPNAGEGAGHERFEEGPERCHVVGKMLRTVVETAGAHRTGPARGDGHHGPDVALVAAARTGQLDDAPAGRGDVPLV